MQPKWEWEREREREGKGRERRVDYLHGCRLCKRSNWRLPFQKKEMVCPTRPTHVCYTQCPKQQASFLFFVSEWYSKYPRASVFSSNKISYDNIIIKSLLNPLPGTFLFFSFLLSTFFFFISLLGSYHKISRYIRIIPTSNRAPC